MHIYFSGIGGTGIGPLALIALRAGYEVSGSDKQDSSYIDSLRSHGIKSIIIGQTTKSIAKTHTDKPIDWLVYSSAVPKENPEHPELVFARDNGIKATKRDKFLQHLLEETGQKLIAVAGTHGKTTTAAMIVWLFKQLVIPVSYSVGAKLSYGDMGEFDPTAKYFVYEADEYDRNFLSFTPHISVISGLAYDHPDIYPSQNEYNQAFIKFIKQSNCVVAYNDDMNKLGKKHANVRLIDKSEASNGIELTGVVNRQNALLAVNAISQIAKKSQFDDLIEFINNFPGLSRRFEEISDNIYSDYAHTPEKIAGALQMASEVASENVVVVYEGLHNSRQHFIKDQLNDLFSGVKKLYVVPSYLAREDESLELLTPDKLCALIQEPSNREPGELDDNLKISIEKHTKSGDLVLCLSAGGGGSLDEWVRQEF